jgi:hypothetical protein
MEKNLGGRPNKIKDEEHLIELFNKYKEETKSKPFIVKDYVGKEAELVYREKERPLTMEGFNTFVFHKGIRGGLVHYFNNTNGKYKRFLNICTHIKEEIRQDQIEGGMAGMYNPSITQRLNNLVEKTQQTIIEQPLFGEDNESEEIA